MGFFDNAREFLANGITPGLKKKYSPFLSAALLYLKDFKIEKLDDLGHEAMVSSIDGAFRIELKIYKNDSKIDELRTTIFDYLTKDFVNSISAIKPLGEFISYEEFKLSGTSRKFQNERDFIKLLSQRSYIDYLFTHPKKDDVMKYFDIKNKVRTRDDSLHSIMRKINSNQFLSPLIDRDPLVALDSQFKSVDNFQRIKLATSVNDLSSFNNWDPELNRLQEMHEATNGYRILDIWVLKLTVSNLQNILFEDIVLVKGQNGSKRNMHEDDFLFFSDAMNNMIERWSFFKYNNK